MNIYIQQIKEISYDNKYTKWYVNIVERALLRATSRKQAKKILGYCERHHIVPESFFIERKRKGPKGVLEGNPEHPDNFVFLTAKEHIFCHLFLIKMANNMARLSKAVAAVNRMLVKENSNEVISPRIYSFLKEQLSENSIARLSETKENIKKTKLEKYGDENYNNREQAKETCLELYGVEFPSQIQGSTIKAKKSKKEKYNDENYNNREQAKETWIKLYGVDNPNKNPEIRKKSEETCLDKYGVENISQVIVVCPWCNASGGLSGMMTQHFDNCPHNPNFNPAEIQCPHCLEKSISTNSPFKRWHFDYCSENPNKISRYDIEICPHCGTEGTAETNIYRYHFDNCPKNPNRTNIGLVSCIYCGMEGDYNNLTFQRWHLENCAKNPENGNLICPHCGFASRSEDKMKRKHFDKCVDNPANKDKIIICPVCNKKGTSKRNMMVYHFDNCKHK